MPVTPIAEPSPPNSRWCFPDVAAVAILVLCLGRASIVVHELSGRCGRRCEGHGD